MKRYKTIDTVIRVRREHEETIIFEVVLAFGGKTKHIGPDIDGLSLTPCQAVVRAAERVVEAVAGRTDALTIYTSDKQALALMTGTAAPKTPEMRELVGQLRAAMAAVKTRVVFAYSGDVRSCAAVGANG